MSKLSIVLLALFLVAGCEDGPPLPAPKPADTSRLSRPSGELPRPPAGKLPDELRPPR